MPVDNISTFLSYNSTGLNTVKTKWIRDIIQVTKSDFTAVQECFKRLKLLTNTLLINFLDTLLLLSLDIVKVDKTVEDQKVELPC